MEDTKKCQICGKEFRKKRGETTKYWAKKSCCSVLCGNRFIAKNRTKPCGFKKGHVPWNKNMKGLRLSPQTEFKKGNKPWNAGIKTTRGSYNREARKLFLASGKLLICENCQTTKKIQIHHKDKDYKNQDINNLQPLCGECHAKHHY